MSSTVHDVNAFEITSVLLPRRRREITVTSAEPVVVGAVKQGRSLVLLEWESGIGTATVRPGPCDVFLHYEDGKQHIEHLNRHKRARMRWGHRTPRMPRRYAEYR